MNKQEKKPDNAKNIRDNLQALRKRKVQTSPFLSRWIQNGPDQDKNLRELYLQATNKMKKAGWKISASEPPRINHNGGSKQVEILFERARPARAKSHPKTPPIYSPKPQGV